MAYKGMTQLSTKDLWTIPNIITYFRMICVPVFIVLMALGGVWSNLYYFYSALGVFFIASASDLIDGWIARKFNMCSGVGMIFDPLADKLMHISVLMCLAFCTGCAALGKNTSHFPEIDGGWYVHYGFVIAIMLKEIVLVINAPIAMKKKAKVEANMLGKVASFTVSVGVIMGFFHPYLYFADWGILAWGITLGWASAISYLKDVIVQARLVSKAIKDGTYIEGETGRDIQNRIAAEKAKQREEELKKENEEAAAKADAEKTED